MNLTSSPASTLAGNPSGLEQLLQGEESIQLKGNGTFLSNLTNSKSEKIKTGTLTSEFWFQTKAIDQIKKQYNEAKVDFEKDKNLANIIKVFKLSLSMAGISDKELEKEFLGRTSTLLDILEKDSYFLAITHLAKNTFDRYLGIDCKKINLVKECVFQLKRTLELDLNISQFKRVYDQSLDEIKKAWIDLEQIGEINIETHQHYLIQLENFLTEDPFKEEFQKNPNLFNLVKKAPKAFNEKFPHLTTVEAFFEKYPLPVLSKEEKKGILISNYWKMKGQTSQFKAEFNQAHEELTKNKNNIILLGKAVQASLRVAAFSNAKVEINWVNYAINCKEAMKQQHYFNGASHYCDYLITRYQGIDCRKLIIVKEALLQLRRVIELDSKFLEARKELELMQKEIKDAWKELEVISEIDSKTHQKYLFDLNYFLSEDPFKSDFLKNPDLFNLVHKAPEDFKSRHPSLLSKEKFLEKYSPQKSKPLLSPQSNLGILVSEYSQPVKKEESDEFLRIQDALVRTPNDLKLIAASFWPGLKMPMVSTSERGVGGIYYAIHCKEIIKKANYFSGLPHHFEYTITRYNKIDCQDLSIVRLALNQLKRSLELDPTSQRARKDYNELLEDVKKAWNELEQAKVIQPDTHQKYLNQLEAYRREDAFKEEFEKDPTLFKLFQNAPEECKKKFSHLLSMDSFIKKYPNSSLAKKIDLSGIHPKINSDSGQINSK
ncbi:MAG: hypothetical protein H0V82_04375 [Candidatus Protochlamydia sp.]|nr:hypothetical protein [Candidatus Protochlamydia sp.]